MPYKPTIGLEIHAELKTNSKMFCGCKNDPDEKRPNFNICPVCTAQPGTLPVANEEAIKILIFFMTGDFNKVKTRNIFQILKLLSFPHLYF